MDCVLEFEKYAHRHLEHQTWRFFSQGAEREQTLQDNVNSFSRYTFIPRMLRNTAERDLSTTLLGRKVSFPVAIAPVGYQRMAHPMGETAAARAASESGTIYTLSTVATTSVEELASNVPDPAGLWMQLYVTKDEASNRALVRRAERAGYSALVITVDTPVLGLRRGEFKLSPHLSTPNLNFVSSVNFAQHCEMYDTALSWEHIASIKKFTSLPIIIKGILTAEDAVLALEHGASAVWVSNHGGRQLDGVSAPLDVLSSVCGAVAGRCEVYMDGGVRWGSDVVKALALGARAVFIGRPVLWGLAHSGQEGVKKVLEILRSEMDRTMHLAGCSKISDIGPQLLQKRYSSKI